MIKWKEWMMNPCKECAHIITIICFLFNLQVDAREASFSMQEDDHPDYYKKPDKKKTSLSESHHNYSDLAHRITKGCTSDYQKIRAIYQWICSNIDYDTTYSIHTADSCMDAKKGVCQAYCELFCQIARALDIKVEIITGKTRSRNDAIGSVGGHSWLFAFTRKKHGILMDPTWGAGSVDNGHFHRNDDCWQWFNVDPEWMALSHFPDKASNQLFKKPLSSREFAALPPINNLWLRYGLDVHDIFTRIRTHSLSLPEFYTRGEDILQLADIPFLSSLKIGQSYTFRIKLKQEETDVSFIVDGQTYGLKEDWKKEGGGVYSIDFMPRATGDLCLCLKNRDDEQHWNTIVKYHIDPPMPSDWKNVEPLYPLSLPEVQHVANLEPKEWEQAGIDNHRLLEIIRKNNVKALPVLYSSKGQKLEIVDVPMSKTMSRGQHYRFRFYPKSGQEWVITNEGVLLTDWEVADDGMYSMNVKPEKAGKLSLSVQFEEGQSYWITLEYDVE